MSMVATWARVASPWGLRLPSMPLMMPRLTAQVMASEAQVLTLAVFVATAAVSAVNGLKSDEPEVVSVVKAADSEDGYTTFYVPDGENFEILALTDTQVKYPVNNYETDYGGSNENTFTLVKRLVESADPDLVIITGDLVMSQFVNNMAYFRRYAELFEELPPLPLGIGFLSAAALLQGFALQLLFDLCKAFGDITLRSV